MAMLPGKCGKTMFDAGFYQNKKVLITGHTGFVGSWLSHVLLGFGADVSGYALNPIEKNNLFSICNLEKRMDSTIADIRDFETLKKTMELTKPEIVMHLAAQPIVRESYLTPRETYEINVMGTVNLLECMRTAKEQPVSFVNITTDKVYLNHDKAIGFVENDPLDGFDPYSNSKSCSELATHSYKSAFFNNIGIATSTARAGNIIGGGDFGKDRILPDCVAAALRKETIMVRNPHSIRPYQHVLESVFAYLLIAERQYENPQFADCYNIGPNVNDCKNTAEIADLFCKYWGGGITWRTGNETSNAHEAAYLKLNCSKVKDALGWESNWDIENAIAKTVEWFKVYAIDGDVTEIMNKQIESYLK